MILNRRLKSPPVAVLGNRSRASPLKHFQERGDVVIGRYWSNSLHSSANWDKDPRVLGSLCVRILSIYVPQFCSVQPLMDNMLWQNVSIELYFA